MSMKLNAVERRSRELLLTQGAAMSGAAVALSGLGTRLEGLVDQLIASYNISVKDLEVSGLRTLLSSRAKYLAISLAAIISNCLVKMINY